MSPFPQGNLWDKTTTNGPFKSADLAHLGVPGGYQNLADASALLKNLAHAIMALLPLPEQMEVLLGYLSLGLGLPGLSSHLTRASASTALPCCLLPGRF